MSKPLAFALISSALMTLSSTGIADFKVTEADPTCRNAHALLVASRSDKHSYIWREISKVAHSDRDKWKVVDDYQPGVVKRLSLRQYQVSGNAGASAYVVHCGHGGTCNSLAQAYFKEHPDWYSPEVFCGALPAMLESPSQPR